MARVLTVTLNWRTPAMTLRAVEAALAALEAARGALCAARDCAVAPAVLLVKADLAAPAAVLAKTRPN